MNKLLHWSIENKGQSDEKVTNIDPKWIDIILGKTDSVHVQEQFEEIQNSDIDHQRQLLIDLEDYACDIDKANAIKDWKFLINLLNTKELKDLIYSLLGTIMQNNPEAQKPFLNFMKWDIIFEDLKLDNQVITDKIMYCLSSVMPTNNEIMKSFEDNNGFQKVVESVMRSVVDSKKLIYFLTKNKSQTTKILTPANIEKLNSLPNSAALLKIE
eukprot:NODE_229_length_12207_cov_1.116700.p9 type:complete len:213 gc:universal NODE_229_length_12207_cov_1.116700:6085-6723(+)